MGTRCGRCKRTLPDEAFSPANRGKDGKYCRVCFKAYNAERWANRPPEQVAADAARNKAWAEAHAEEQAAWHAEYRRRPEVRARKRAHNLRRDFGLTPEEFDALLELQGGACAICLGPPHGGHNGRVLHVDHDHTTGAVRGLLCQPCNVALGNLKEDTERMRRMIHYVESR